MINSSDLISHDIEVEVREPAWRAVTADPQAYCRAVAIRVLDQQPDSCELSIVLGDDQLLRELNRTYRDKDAPTDVLSFEADAPTGRAAPISVGGGPLRLLGDVVIAHGVATRDAEKDLGIPADQHLAHLVVHGILHLLGYDHEIESEALEMEALEVKILSDMGIANPYGAAAGVRADGSGVI